MARKPPNAPLYSPETERFLLSAMATARRVPTGLQRDHYYDPTPNVYEISF
jgi:hypothetical protein